MSPSNFRDRSNSTALPPESNNRSHGTIYRLDHFVQAVPFKVKTESLETALWIEYERSYVIRSKPFPLNHSSGRYTNAMLTVIRYLRLFVITDFICSYESLL